MPALLGRGGHRRPSKDGAEEKKAKVIGTERPGLGPGEERLCPRRRGRQCPRPCEGLSAAEGPSEWMGEVPSRESTNPSALRTPGAHGTGLSRGWRV